MRILNKFQWLTLLTSLPVASGLMLLALDWRSPRFAAYRLEACSVFIVLALVTLTVLLRWLKRNAVASRKAPRLVATTGALVTLAALLVWIAQELNFQWMRYTVTHAPSEQLTRLGRHFVVGYRDQQSLEQLIALNGIGGVFITGHNVRNQDAVAIAATVSHFQEIRRNLVQPPLWVATDQEGGHVSRMSPPLPRQPALAELLEGQSEGESIENAVRAYAKAQGAALAALGINVNFAPVIDLNYHIINSEDRHTRIYQRAIASDPDVVLRVAGWYCDELASVFVHCTLKHFPGLGQVAIDTHLDTAHIEQTVETLQARDWIPFRTLMRHDSQPFTMLSHVTLDAVDPSRPVSTSYKVVNRLLRQEWRHEGLLISDDFSMESIYRHEGGIGMASVDAINAGVDLILISFDPDLYYPAMYALLEADSSGRLDGRML